MPHVREPLRGVCHPALQNAAAETADQMQRPLFAANEAGGPVITALNYSPVQEHEQWSLNNYAFD